MPQTDDDSRFERAWRSGETLTYVGAKAAFLAEFKKLREETRAAALEEAINLITKEVLATLGAQHPEGRAAAYRDAHLIGTVAKKLEALRPS